MKRNLALMNQRYRKGFTLIEVMITVAIVGILAAISYPSYTGYILQSNRTEAQRELIRMANLQEQIFVDRRVYTTDMTLLGAPADPYLVPRDSTKKLYSIDGTINGRTFVLTATATGVQVNDTDCTTLTINEVGLKTPATGCWE
jgi:type IV pilus assembly protein PilE